MAEFLEKVELSTQNTGLGNYRLTLGFFLETVKRVYVSEIAKLEVLRFSAALRAKGYSERTVYNRHVLLMTFLRYCGVDTKSMVTKNERPVRPENAPQSYETGELQTLFAGITKTAPKMLYEFLWKQGCVSRKPSF